MREPDDFIYDVRVRDRMIRAGRLTAEGLDAHWATLADCASEAEQIVQDQPALGRGEGGASPARAGLDETTVAPEGVDVPVESSP